MSIFLAFLRATDEQLEELLDQPSKITEFLYPESGPRYEPGMPITETDECGLDKAWHALHFLFTGTAWEGEPPANFLLKGGRKIGDVDVGYGPARAASSIEVQAFNEFLGQIDKDQLRNRYIPERLTAADIYPGIWEVEQESAFEYVVSFLPNLEEYIAETARRQSGLVIWKW